jgi:hypothetical protein
MRHVNSNLMMELGRSVSAVMRLSGMSANDVRDCLMACVEVSGEDQVWKGVSRVDRSSDLAVGCDSAVLAGHVLREWHRNPNFLNRDAEPRPLRLHEGRRGLDQIIKIFDKSACPKILLKDLRDSGFVRVCGSGRYLPTSRLATVSRVHVHSLDHLTKTILRLIRTAQKNMTTASPRSRLIERYAQIPNLDPNLTKEFVEFTRKQGAAYLEAVEDWLEVRQVKAGVGAKAGKLGVPAGVHVMAYVERDESDGLSTAKIAKKKITKRVRSFVAPSAGSSRHYSSAIPS